MTASHVSPFIRDKIRGVVVRTDQGYFCLDPDEQFVSRALLSAGAYGVGEVERARQFVTPDSCVLVVGAHIGTLAVPLSRSCRELVAIEANPRTFELLELNVLMNRCTNVRLHNVAANDRDAPIEFVMSTHNSGGSKRMPLHRDETYFYDNPQVVQVRGVRLDDLLGGSGFDVILMDIEGSEYFAFLGMQRLLAGAGTLIVEFLPHHLSRVAGITVEQFLQPLAGHFRSLLVPSTQEAVGAEGFRFVLEGMFDENQGDAGVIFRK
jgi:FkbM family methyltransferase